MLFMSFPQEGGWYRSQQNPIDKIYSIMSQYYAHRKGIQTQETTGVMCHEDQ